MSEYDQDAITKAAMSARPDPWPEPVSDDAPLVDRLNAAIEFANEMDQLRVENERLRREKATWESEHGPLTCVRHKEIEAENQRLHDIFKSVGVPMTARAFMERLEKAEGPPKGADSPEDAAL